jgi:predicted Zn-dependent protease with MMP-like domain
MTFETLTETEWVQIERVWNALDEGDFERAHTELIQLERRRRDHPDVRVVAAAVALDEGDPATALERLEGAERSADPAFFFYLRARARYDACDFADARADAARSLAIQPDAAEVHDLLSRIADHLGESEAAAEHAAEATDIDPETFPPPLEVDDEAFDRVVKRSLAELPEGVRRHLDEWPVIVAFLPTREMLTAESPPLSPDLLGLFVGQHLLERSYADAPGTPGTIHLFRRNLLRMCRDREELEAEIQTTVRHEVGHLLGLDEDDLEEWGLA